MRGSGFGFGFGIRIWILEFPNRGLASGSSKMWWRMADGVDVCFDPSLTGAKLKALFFYQEEANADLQHPGSVISVSFLI
jgi:hypothetical protein